MVASKPCHCCAVEYELRLSRMFVVRLPFVPKAHLDLAQVVLGGTAVGAPIVVVLVRSVSTADGVACERGD